LQKYCEQNNLKIVKELAVVESSKIRNKKEFLEMINFINKQKTKTVLVVDSIDRLHRAFEEISYIDDLVKNDKIEVCCVRENLLHKRCIKSKRNVD
jgi:DNA invertase Pin-like site-specific DNA recombinase